MSTPVRDALDRSSQPWLFATAIAPAPPHALHQPLWLTALTAACIAWAVALLSFAVLVGNGPLWRVKAPTLARQVLQIAFRGRPTD